MVKLPENNFPADSSIALQERNGNCPACTSHNEQTNPLSSSTDVIKSNTCNGAGANNYINNYSEAEVSLFGLLELPEFKPGAVLLERILGTCNDA